MKFYFVVRGFESLENGFPIDGIQLQLNKDLGDYDDLSLEAGTDLFFDVDSVDYYVDGKELIVCANSESLMIDGNETYLDVDGKTVYDLVRNSKLTEIVVSGDYCGNQKLLKKLKAVGSMSVGISDSLVFKKTNKVVFY